MIGILEKDTLLADERVIAAPGVDADAFDRRSRGAFHPLLELEPNPEHIPLEGSVLPDRLVDEAVDLADVEDTRAQPAEHGPAALGSEIERQKMSTCGHRGFYVGPTTFRERLVTPKQTPPPILRRRRKHRIRSPPTAAKASFGWVSLFRKQERGAGGNPGPGRPDRGNYLRAETSGPTGLIQRQPARIAGTSGGYFGLQNGSQAPERKWSDQMSAS